MIKITQTKSESLFATNQLSISKWILSKNICCMRTMKNWNLINIIDQHRQNILTQIFVYLQNVFKQYKNNERNCHRKIECDKMILNFLTINLNAINILQSFHFSYNDFFVKYIFQNLQKMRMFQYCKKFHDCENIFYISNDKICEKIKKNFEIKIEKLKQNFQKIKLTIEKYKWKIVEINVETTLKWKNNIILFIWNF